MHVPPPTAEPLVHHTAADTTPPPSSPAYAGTPASKRVLLVVLSILLVLAIGGGTVWYLHRRAAANPLAAYAKRVAFPIYYPSPLPEGYHLQAHSAHIENNVVFYTINGSYGSLLVSEQAIPSQVPDFKKIQQMNDVFKQRTISAGTVLAGVYKGHPTAIIETNTTLINISTSDTVPQATVNTLTDSLSPLPR